MKDVSVISPLPVQVPDPVCEGSLDELQDTLVPVQEEDLPQGVLELMATVILRHRPALETGRALAWHSMAATPGMADVEGDRAQSTVPVTMTYPQEGQLPGRSMLHLTPPAMALMAPAVDTAHMTLQGAQGAIDSRPLASSLPAMPMIERLPVGTGSPPIERSSTTTGILPIERPSTATATGVSPFERPSTTSELSSFERTANARVPIPRAREPQLPEALQPPPGARHAASIVPATVASPPTQRSVPVLDRLAETLPGPDRGLLQVPFNKGTASGQVTISRVPDEPTRYLQLSPSNALVFEQLKVPFEQVREAAWQLTDSGGGQQHQGSQQAPDDEQDEHPELPA